MKTIKGQKEQTIFQLITEQYYEYKPEFLNSDKWIIVNDLTLN
jgi:hypothetical protein